MITQSEWAKILRILKSESKRARSFEIFLGMTSSKQGGCWQQKSWQQKSLSHLKEFWDNDLDALRQICGIWRVHREDYFGSANPKFLQFPSFSFDRRTTSDHYVYCCFVWPK